MQNISIRIKNYKCFGEETGFDCIKRVNVIIGRNNSGKSSLLDVIERVASTNYVFDPDTWRGNSQPKVIFESIVPEEVTTRVFPSTTSGGKIIGRHSDYGKLLIGKSLRWTKSGSGKQDAALVECNDEGINPPLSQTGGYDRQLTSNMPINIQGKSFKKISAERDITPEKDSGGQIHIHSNGTGITDAIQCFINRSNLSSDIVETELLNALNVIFAHDATFTDVVCQLHGTGHWEIYLEERHKGRISLSKSGSGLKTVIMVITYLILLPQVEKKSLHQYIFAFEELENNIHPSLLRRLNQYIYKKSLDDDFIYFITTHSNVLIDQFSKQEDAQIIHVTHNNGASVCYPAKTYIENNGILDDLDVRASDLLQANGVIWVEGPSDRIYLNRWIELWSKGELREGTHYQCMFYGGRLLSHLSAEEPELVKDSISILNVNRNSIILIDSDKRAKQTSINDTKRRIIEEFKHLGSIVWVTKGREIENYIPKEAVDSYWNLENTTQVDQFASFFDHIDSCIKDEGKKYFGKKPLLAERLVKYMSKNNLSAVLDVERKMTAISQRIRDWNS